MQLQTGEGVEGAEGLVEEDDGRIGGEGAGEGDALSLAAGELGGVARAVDGGVEPDQLQHLARPRLAALRVPAQERGTSSTLRSTRQWGSSPPSCGT